MALFMGFDAVGGHRECHSFVKKWFLGVIPGCSDFYV